MKRDWVATITCHHASRRRAKSMNQLIFEVIEPKVAREREGVMVTNMARFKPRAAEPHEDQGGFTLIELLIVVVVLGILAAIVVFAAQNLTSASAASACGSDVKNVEISVEAYKIQTGDYPLNVAVLTVSAMAPDGVTVVGPWLRSDPSNEHYVIETSGGAVTVDSPAGDPSPLAAPLDISVVPDACAQATA